MTFSSITAVLVNLDTINSSDEVNLAVLSSKLPIFKIYSNQELDRNKAIFSTITYYDDGSDLYSDTFVAQIRIRGFTVANLPKKGFKFELDRNFSFNGLIMDRDWELFAGFLDLTKVRTKLAFDLWNTLQNDYATRLPNTCYSVVYWNDQYQGIYLLSEKYNNHLSNLTSEDGGNFMIQVDNLGDISKYDPKLVQKWPKTSIYNAFEEKIPSMINFIYNSDDNQFYSPINGVYSVFDRQNLIDFYIYNEFILHLDFWDHNYYIIYNNEKKKYFLVPWDFDGSFGQIGVRTYDTTSNSNASFHPLYNRLLNNTEFQELVKNRWEELRNNHFKDSSLNYMINSSYYQIDSLLDLEIKQWELNDYYTNSDYNFEQISAEYFITKIREFIKGRIDFFDLKYT